MVFTARPGSSSTQRRRKNRPVAWAAIGVTAVLALAGCSGAATGGEADGAIPTTKLQLATYIGPQTPYGVAVQNFVDDVADRSDGAVTIEVFWEGALLNGPDVLTGVADGRADLGFSSSSYSPAELPLTQVVAVPFVSSDVAAVQNAFGELAENNEDYQQEWSALGVRPLTFQAVTPNVMLGETEPENVAWIKGKSIRATSLMANAIQDAGGNAATLALSEVYESAQRGLIEGAASLNFGTIPSVSLEEVMPYVTDPGTGVYGATALFANEGRYAQLDDEVRDVLDGAVADFNGDYLEQLAVFDAETCDKVLAAGGSVTQWPASETKKWKDALGDSILDEWKSNAAASSDADVEAFYEEYLALLESGVESDYVDGVAACADR